MARAKKTDRAEVRRRSRATAGGIAAAEPAEPGLPAADTSTSSRVRRLAGFGRSASSAPATPPGPAPASVPATISARPGIFSAFRAAYRPVHLREDLRDLPWLVTRTHAVWLPAVLIAAATAWFWASGGSVGLVARQRFPELSGIAFNLFVYPPPLGAAFLAGVLATRMSYLAGLIAGIVSLVAFSIFMMFGPAGEMDLPLGVTETALRGSWVWYALTVAPLSGMAFGAAAGFYRRFLRLASPKAARNQNKAKDNKAAARR